MRDRDTGTLYFDNAKGRWIAKLQTGLTPRGAPRYTKRSALTRPEAVKLLKRLTVEREKGELSTGKDQTFQEFTMFYYDHSGSQRIRATTKESYLYLFSHYVFPAIGKKKLRAITRQDLEQLLYGLRERLAAETVNQVRTLIRHVFKVALEDDLVTKNPMGGIAKFKRDALDPTFKRLPPDADEMRNILNLAKGTDLELFFHIACSTGMRRGEILGLHWEDINFDLGTLTVNRTLREGTRVARDGTSITRPTYNPPKTKASRRTIRLAPPVLDLLHLAKVCQDINRAAAGESWIETDAVFTNQVGTEVWPSNFSKKVDRFFKKHGLRKFRIHDIRHGFACVLLDAGHPLEEITDQLGHSSIQITKDTYGSYAPRLAQRAAVGMANALYPGVPMEETVSPSVRVSATQVAPGWTPR